MDNPEKLPTQSENKQNKPKTQHEFDTSIRKQTQIT